jgi:uroporphyrinogen decarboxylase
MDAMELKAEFGEGITFWGGGCDTRRILSNATPQEVAHHVKRQVDSLSPGGGFVFQQVHNAQADLPPENLLAMFEAVIG